MLENLTKTRSAKADSKKRRLVYIMSPSYSGSTLLTMMLAQHPKFATTGEMKATAMGPIENYVCSCGDKLLECRFWNAVINDARQSKIGFTLENFGTHFTSSNLLQRRILGAQLRGKGFEFVRRFLLDNMPGLKHQYQNILHRNKWLTDITCELQGADICIDGSKDPHRLSYLIRSGLWSVDVLRMHRDGRAQCNSMRKKEHVPLGYSGAVKEWKHAIDQMDRVCEMIPAENLYTFQYESLCEDPNKELTSIFDFLEIEQFDIDWKDIDLKGTEHHILGNSMRNQDRIQIALDTRWHSQVSKQELEVFEATAGKTNSELGYFDLNGEIT